MKRHPILMATILMCGFLVIFFLSVFGVMYFRGEKTLFIIGDKIAVVNIQGIIKDSTDTIDQLLRFKKDKSVKAIILRIDSPGGGIGPTQEIYEAVKKIRDEKKKNVFVSMGSVAASGGYYIACAADKILANPGTITGSIGVIVEFGNVEELMKKIGFESVIIKSGEYKDVMSPFRVMTKEERALLQGVVDTIHEQFVQTVAENRSLKRKEVAKIADGRIFSGEQAKALGLVDDLGTLQDTISLAAQVAGIKGEPNIVYSPEKKFSILDLLFEGIASSLLSHLKDEPFRFSFSFRTQ